MLKRNYKSGDHIAVIGAGAAGLGVVRSLIEHGVAAQNIILLEKNASAGGKVETIMADGRPYELGAQMIVPGLYQSIENLIEMHGLTTRPMNRSGLFDLTTGTFGRDSNTDLEFIAQLAKYTAMYELSWHVVSEPKGFGQIPPEINVPWPQFVKEQGFERLQQSLGTLLGGSGFLRPDHPPIAAQVIRMITPYALWCATTHGIRALNGGGFQELWQVEANSLEKMGVSVRYNTEVKEIVRMENNTRIVLGANIPPLDVEQVFYTGDLAYLPDLLKNITDAEKDLYARVLHYDYRSFILRVEGLPNANQSGTSGFAPAMYQMPIGQALLTVKPYADSQIAVYYAYGAPGISNDQIVDNIKSELARFNGSLSEVVAAKQWLYFPHVDSDLKGFFNSVMELEGIGGVWMVGEATSYTATIQVYEQGRDFAELFVRSEL